MLEEKAYASNLKIKPIWYPYSSLSDKPKILLLRQDLTLESRKVVTSNLPRHRLEVHGFLGSYKWGS